MHDEDNQMVFARAGAFPDVGVRAAGRLASEDTINHDMMCFTHVAS